LNKKAAMMTKRNIFNIFLLVVFFCALIAMIVQLFPLLRSVLENIEDESGIVDTVNALGWRGYPALVGLTALQVIIPLVPAAVIGVLAGLTYGFFWGTLVVLVGIALGNLLVVFAIRQIDVFFVGRKKRKAKSTSILSRENLEKIKRPEIAAFFLFMIPFISGAGPYLFAETNVKMWKYIVAVVAGSIPTTIIYVLLGERISQGSYITAIVTASVFVVMVILILVLRKRIISMIMGKFD